MCVLLGITIDSLKESKRIEPTQAVTVVAVGFCGIFFTGVGMIHVSPFYTCTLMSGVGIIHVSPFLHLSGFGIIHVSPFHCYLWGIL